jgi:hypothetical protein
MSYMKPAGHPDYGSPTADVRFKGGGGGTTQTTVENRDPWSQQQPFLKTGFEEAQRIYDSTQPSYYSDPTVAGFNPTQQLAQAAGTQRAIGGSPVLQSAQGEAFKSLQGDYLREGNPYLGNVMSNIENTVLPRIDSRFSGAGRGRGSGIAQATAAQAATTALAPFAFNSYNQERGRMGAAMAMAPNLAQADYNDINALSAIGSQQQVQAQQEINADIMRHNFEQNREANKLAQYMQLIGNPGYGGTAQGTTTGTQPGGRGGSIGGLMSGAGSLIGGTATMMGKSDRRLKRNIIRLGELASGLPYYLFKYLWSEEWHVGVMAQEAMNIFPDAVVEVDGYLAVDYARIG